ncbi:MAG: hypothetical protein WC070_04070 [Candidatus Magasanikbacteria bacterium]
MNRQGFTNTFLLIITLVVVAVLAGSFVFFQKQKNSPPTDTNIEITTTTTKIPTPPVAETTITLSADKKSIMENDKVLLKIDNETIFNWFKTKSQLCEGYNLTSAPDREKFCTDQASFKSQTRFSSIVVSTDKTKVGFTIESDTLTPDEVVGIFLTSNNKLELLSNYYLGNEFISFSPENNYFVYKGNCWEGLCGLFVKDATTLKEKISLNNPEFLDMKSVDIDFIRWVTDTKIEYKLGTETKQSSF